MTAGDLKTWLNPLTLPSRKLRGQEEMFSKTGIRKQSITSCVCLSILLNGFIGNAIVQDPLLQTELRPHKIHVVKP